MDTLERFKEINDHEAERQELDYLNTNGNSNQTFRANVLHRYVVIVYNRPAAPSSGYYV